MLMKRAVRIFHINKYTMDKKEEKPKKNLILDSKKKEGWVCPLCNISINPDTQLCPLCVDNKDKKKEYLQG